MPKFPLDYAGPSLQQKRRMHPALKWLLIIIVCSIVTVVMMVAYLIYYVHSLGPFGD